ncbi:MAG TPA: hypothetical protein VFI24_15450 [Pyrinomonadaceae bacterium]|nr:hypothetical protein [Pyrinomonadaceae bacterium]
MKYILFLLLVFFPVQIFAQRDGQHDFDWEIGSWKTQLKRLQRPLSNSTTWVEYEGTTEVSRVLDGRANLVELKVNGPAGRIEGLSLRLYNPQTKKWSLNFANVSDGQLTTPSVGEFKDGRGEFYNEDQFNGRAILVRFVITKIIDNSYRFEQSFSADGGKTWEANWIAIDTRIKR